MTTWLTRTPEPSSRLRLFCFHYAGGGASFYTRWHGRLLPEVDVLPVQLPGRESRYGEPRFRDIRQLAAVLDRELDAWMDRPYALYGHSMGALIAYAVVRARQERGATLPEALFAASAAAPHLAPSTLRFHDWPDDVLARHLVDLGGLDPVFLQQQEWLTALLPIVRDDLRVCGSLQPGDDGGPLPVGVHAFAGERDPLINAEAHVRPWERHARDFRMTTLPGGHFFPRDVPEPFFDALNTALEDLLDPVGADGLEAA